jgi:hypothetical protein
VCCQSQVSWSRVGQHGYDGVAACRWILCPFHLYSKRSFASRSSMLLPAVSVEKAPNSLRCVCHMWLIANHPKCAVTSVIISHLFPRHGTVPGTEELLVACHINWTNSGRPLHVMQSNINAEGNRLPCKHCYVTLLASTTYMGSPRPFADSGKVISFDTGGV